MKKDNIPKKSLYNNPVTIYDLDRLWAENDGIYLSPDCNWLIDIWNFFSDFFTITKQTFIGDSSDTCISNLYDKLFYGCNLLIEEKDKYYYPNWSTEDITLLKKVMLSGVENFAKWVQNSTEDGYAC